MTPATAELIYSYLDDFTEDVICEAIKKASVSNIRNAKYICGILNDWKNKNIRTLIDIDNEEQEHNRKKNKNNLVEETDEQRMARKIKSLEEAFGNGN